MYSPSPHRPISRHAEKQYERLAALSGFDGSGRQLWRVKAATPEGRKVRDVQVRVWRVPSSRDEHAYYLVNLNTKECQRFSATGTSECPDKKYGHKERCCHYLAALRAESGLLAENADNLLIFGKEEFEPAEAA